MDFWKVFIFIESLGKIVMLCNGLWLATNGALPFIWGSLVMDC